ncbi:MULTISPECIES: DUF2489 domain-containing protein [unclassified Idiomarina]|jgi:hypothetical protein|uniref:DUF2489 domain-containing protein n=1 Tax=unclassified Idiomarina TaxID=2614829 RepID=UPI0008F7FFA1|nr:MULTISPECIES: DUF2489 domain-containing protein [unclassified Idiomarina]MAD53636.1 DUF2489 domain-containing protein [Idiomarinaceae bacterium]MEC7643924.1 DUF2489 domain-containing protein [Pseudomonadota bacterium]MEC9318267.1 DUF2489 domain-containing protein [Pseudomonadota bacterium]NQZ03059.1 DUF2489 domain-containing protein [Idiomarina sp.]OIM99080.1 hypothetical protein BFR57_00410 [Idiomarina sp. MD25a]|tara:strand:+ start:7296 stop:7751 length:456 start_codon:yes stop_codon:yes gene_type:complete
MSTLAIVLYILGVVVIVGLAVYAMTLLKRLRYQNQLRQQAVQKRVDRIDESIITIAKGMQQDQCPLSEGCLRIVVLLDHRPESTEYDYSKDYPAMHDMYERIKHMPTHENRKKFPKQKIKELDKEREGYEAELKDVILADVDKLLREFPTR